MWKVKKAYWEVLTLKVIASPQHSRLCSCGSQLSKKLRGNEGTHRNSQQVAGEAIWDLTGAEGEGWGGGTGHDRWTLPTAMGMMPLSCQLPGRGLAQHRLAKDEYESQVGPLCYG